MNKEVAVGGVGDGVEEMEEGRKRRGGGGG